MQSCIYEGLVRHRRWTPVANAFSYRVFMMYLDLAELPELFDGYWLWSARRRAVARFDRKDHLGDPARPLDECVRDLVERPGEPRPKGPIRLLTHLRYWGHCFNPVSFYYCYDAAGKEVQTIVAEVNNTPWCERRAYVLGRSQNEGSTARPRFRFRKDFHVSPFMDLDVDYDWQFTAPASRLAVQMDNMKEGIKFFDATMTLTRRAIDARSLRSVLIQYPLMTVKVIAAIHWQALRLWMKRCPFYPHPGPNGHRTEENMI